MTGDTDVARLARQRCTHVVARSFAEIGLGHAFYECLENANLGDFDVSAGASLRWCRAWRHRLRVDRRELLDHLLGDLIGGTCVGHDPKSRGRLFGKILLAILLLQIRSPELITRE